MHGEEAQPSGAVVKARAEGEKKKAEKVEFENEQAAAAALQDVRSDDSPTDWYATLGFFLKKRSIWD